MKLTIERPFANPETAARKLVELASGIEPVQDGRIHINAPFLYSLKASGPEFGAGIKHAVDEIRRPDLGIFSIKPGLRAGLFVGRRPGARGWGGPSAPDGNRR
ncbi:hypothetical protein QA640_46295 (plasmid) [Bradyrhizobium sp. CB82]|uniref:hypothetical protein n=1 Tax=Bradyrhizobium sp. CB82 TaxID=3039159 RepID=UPI0024B1AB1C|nr:hypothetical protein [Bradyrhizobium sp. CB82]WFU45433.1 hypothetical protein QA640_46295 [Bradyrhizobium sp. CB82]